MAPKKPAATDEVVYRYDYIGTDAVVLPDLTGHGIGTIEPGTVVVSPVVVVHHDFVPVDGATEFATACRVAEMYPALAPEPGVALPEPSDETDAGDASATKE